MIRIDLSKLRARWGRQVDLPAQVQAYRAAFLSPRSKQHLLPDLVDYTGALEPAPKDSDLFMQGRAAGRRDVWLRIQAHLNLTAEEVYSLWRGQAVITPEDFTHG